MRIKVTNSIVEIDGDEMARTMWKMVREELILPYIDLKIEYYDLSIQNRKNTDDQITLEAAHAIQKHKIGIKCATITPDFSRLQEFTLPRLFPSPNATIRNIIQGTLFRAPIVFEKMYKPLIANWTHPICIARHGFGDQYIAHSQKVLQGQNACLDIDGEKINIGNFEQSDGVIMVMYNLKNSIINFAHSCFQHAIDIKQDLFLSTKNTVLKEYDGLFVDIFEECYRSYKSDFDKIGISYQHKLIDDMVAYALRNHGGFIWACKNYDGDVQSDMLAQGFGSLGMMSSIMINGMENIYATEAAHGTVTSHHRQRQDGIVTSTNPIASIYAWIMGLEMLAKNENNVALNSFVKALRHGLHQSVNQGNITKDIALTMGPEHHWYTTEDFIQNTKQSLEKVYK